jgi:thioredoxin reductase
LPAARGMSSTTSYDVAIVGGGPAGLSAAIWLGRYLHRVVLVDSGDPRNWETRGVNGFLGQPSVRPADLRAIGRDEARRYDVELVDRRVDRVRKVSDEEFELSLEKNGTTLTAKRLLLAIGLVDVWPEIPGLEKAYGSNAHVCPDCDGWDCRDRKTMVIGHGRGAVGLALNLTTWTDDIIICTNGLPPLMDEAEYTEKLDGANIPVLTESIERIRNREGRIYSVEFRGGLCMDVDKIFFKLGQRPADDLGVQLGCKRDDEDQIVVDDKYHTSVRNVWAAGDIVPGPQLAIAAAGEGAIAALAIHKSLVPEQRKLQKNDRA